MITVSDFYHIVEFGLLIFVEDVCISVHQGYWPIIFFPCGVRVGFWFQGNAGLITWVWKCSPLSVFWKNLRTVINSPVKPSGPRLLFVGRFLIIDFGYGFIILTRAWIQADKDHHQKQGWGVGGVLYMYNIYSIYNLYVLICTRVCMCYFSHDPNPPSWACSCLLSVGFHSEK